MWRIAESSLPTDDATIGEEALRETADKIELLDVGLFK